MNILAFVRNHRCGVFDLLAVFVGVQVIYHVTDFHVVAAAIAGWFI